MRPEPDPPGIHPGGLRGSGRARPHAGAARRAGARAGRTAHRAAIRHRSARLSQPAAPVRVSLPLQRRQGPRRAGPARVAPRRRSRARRARLAQRAARRPPARLATASNRANGGAGGEGKEEIANSPWKTFLVIDFIYSCVWIGNLPYFSGKLAKHFLALKNRARVPIFKLY